MQGLGDSEVQRKVELEESTRGELQQLMRQMPSSLLPIRWTQTIWMRKTTRLILPLPLPGLQPRWSLENRWRKPLWVLDFHILLLQSPRERKLYLFWIDIYVYISIKDIPPKSYQMKFYISAPKTHYLVRSTSLIRCGCASLLRHSRKFCPHLVGTYLEVVLN